MDEVTRILRSKTSLEIFGLCSIKSVSIKDVRRKYKEIAVMVHPDKHVVQMGSTEVSRDEVVAKTTAAFRRLRESLEEIENLLASSSQDEAKLKKEKGSKCKAQRGPTSEAARKKMWAEEEARFLHQQETLKARKALDLFCSSRRKRKISAEESSGNISTIDKDVASSPVELDIDDAAVLRRFGAWKRFQCSAGSDSSAPTSDGSCSSKCSEKTAVTVCELCRRRFVSTEQLRRHETLSELHRQNLTARGQGE